MYMCQDGLSEYLVVCVIQARSSVVKPPGPNTPAAAILNKQPKYVLVQCMYMHGTYTCTECMRYYFLYNSEIMTLVLLSGVLPWCLVLITPCTYSE